MHNVKMDLQAKRQTFLFANTEIPS